MVGWEEMESERMNEVYAIVRVRDPFWGLGVGRVLRVE